MKAFLTLALTGSMVLATQGRGAHFTPLLELPPPRVVSAAADYPGGNHRVEHLLDGEVRTEYSSDSKGVETQVEFDFGKDVLLAGFRHVDRNDPATIAESELVLWDEAGREQGRVGVQHVNRKAEVTFQSFTEPIKTRRVQWRVIRLGPQNYGTVGGAEIAFYEAGARRAEPDDVKVWGRVLSLVERQTGGMTQPLRVAIDYRYAEPVEAVLQVDGVAPQPVHLTPGQQEVELAIPAAEVERRLQMVLSAASGTSMGEAEIIVPPLRKLTVYVLPHSHTDIGYTEIQTDIEEKQVNNLLAGMAAARRTANYPEGSRFVWNVEVLWAADLFLRRMNPQLRDEFFAAVRNGQVALCGMYLNQLTGLCRPEELVRLFRFATQLREQTGVELDSAMISDVPGLTWGTVSAMSSAGIRYLSTAPNYFDRIGDILVQWENKPFWWMGPDGNARVLVWIPFWGYAMSHRYGQMSLNLVEDFLAGLETRRYPYDIAYVRWAGHGDNAVPDPSICEFIRDWNEKYAWPRFVISSTREAFQAFEALYGQELPVVKGDWTPYWEDGAGSSAAETAMNRVSSDRLTQAEAVWAILAPGRYPNAEFEEAWRNVLLYSEHTWGAWCSVSEPNRRETLEQWAVKQSYAAAADRQSRELIGRALCLDSGDADEGLVDVLNTTSWPRTELVILPRDFCEGRDRVTDEEGRGVASQRLRNGELAILAREVPAFGARQFRLERGPAHVLGEIRMGANWLENSSLRVVLDEATGAIKEMTVRYLNRNLVDATTGHGLNEYLYLMGDDPEKLQRNGTVSITVKERGPLVGSLLIRSTAPGAHHLEREVQIIAGMDSVQLNNLVDKERLVAGSYHARDGKESVQFAFPFNVEQGQVRLEVPFGVMRPDADQIPSACKNWFTVGRWVDVSNKDYGVTWVTLDAPLLQVGGVTATLLNSQSNPAAWRKEVGPTQRIYSWAMNNHWGTNYRAYQEGPVRFRYVLRPHRGVLDPVAATRLAVAQTQPLLTMRGRASKPVPRPRLRLTSEEIVVTGLKPSDDGKAVIVRLWGASGHDRVTRLEWNDPQPSGVWLSSTSEARGQKAQGDIPVPAWSLVTLRAEFGDAPR